ncbi:MAG: restriction endonuclease subunit S [Psychrilyobacter sp.]|uniref:restriction endonuclease subunit S n=1 Tax=Psychrilyobacter sp. TaxID=2586924 RepID=UPI003C74337D
MKLENFCEIKNGIPINRYLDLDGNYKIKYFNLRSISNFTIKSENLLEGILKKEIGDQYFTKKGDILLKLAEPNDVVLIDEENTGLVISQYFGVVRVKEKRIDPGYLAHLLNSKKIKHQYKKMLEGGSINILKLSTLKELEVKFPLLDEQIKLRKFWDLLMKKSQLMEKQTELFEVYKREVIG